MFGVGWGFLKFSSTSNNGGIKPVSNNYHFFSLTSVSIITVSKENSQICTMEVHKSVGEKTVLAGGALVVKTVFEKILIAQKVPQTP